MNEEKKMILQMLHDGEITVEEAERLLEAVSDGDARTETAYLAASPSLSPKRILIQVTEQGKTKVNVRLPFALIRAGLKLGKTAGLIGAISATNVQGEMEAAALEALKSIDPDEILASLSEGAISLPHTIINVDDEDAGQHVRIVLE